MSKFAVNGYLETMRMELMDDSIDVNVFNPGHVEVNEHSLNAKSSALGDKEVRRGTTSQGKGKLTLQRCAELYVSVLAYSITDSVVSTQPVLAFTYIKQYL